MSSAAPSVIAGTLTDARQVRGAKVYRLTIDIPIEQAAEFHRVFGVPRADEPTWVAVAKLDQAAHDAGQPRPKKERTRSQRAATLCSTDGMFRRWIMARVGRRPHPGQDIPVVDATDALRELLGIESRRELDGDDGLGERFDALVDQYNREHAGLYRR